MTILLSNFTAAAMCEERLKIGSSCTFITPPIDCSGNYTIYNQTSLVLSSSMNILNDSIYTFIFNQSVGDYSVILCDNTSTQIRVTSEDEEMASLSITIFMMGIIIALFYAAFKMQFSNNELLQWVVKNCVILLGLFLTTLVTAMVATLSDVAGLGLAGELFGFMFILNWGIYIFMIFIFFNFLIKALKLQKKAQQEKRGII